MYRVWAARDAAGKIPGDFEQEVKQALDNIGAVLKTAAMSPEDVVSVPVYLTDAATFDENERRLQGIFQRATTDPDNGRCRQAGRARPR